MHLHCLTLLWNGNIYLLEDLKIYNQENVMYVDSRCCRPVTTTVGECSEEVGSVCSDMSGQSAMSAPGKSTNYRLSPQHIIGSVVPPLSLLQSIHIRTYIHTYVHAYIHTCIYTYTHAYIHTHTNIHT